MQQMRYFIDTHDKQNGTFPPDITPEALAEFYKQYANACKEEGVISVNIHTGLEEGRAYCLNIAPNMEAVRKVHEKVGLPYDTITEVKSISSGDILL